MGNSYNKISTMIDKDLRRSGDKGFALTRNRLVGEKVMSYGVRTSEIRKIIRKYRKDFQELRAARDCFGVASELISRRILDDQMAGVFLLGLSLKNFERIDVSEIEKLITRYIDNWATCDAISSEVFAEIQKNSPKKIETLSLWAKSKNIWLRRAALVTVVKLKNKIKDWQEVAFTILSSFSGEKEPIVKKAVHWLEGEID